MTNLGFRSAIAVLMILMATACSPERQLARRFAKNPQAIAALVLLPNEVWLVNEKSDYPKNSFTFEQAAHDARLLENTFILTQLNNQSVLKLFADSYLTELRNYGLKVFTEDQMADFLRVDSNAYVLNVAQIELQEYYSPVHDEVLVSETVYTYDFSVNAFNMGVWLEFSKVNDKENAKPEVLFATHDLLDRYEGYFTMRFMTGKVDYKLTVDTLTIERINNFISYLGRLYAAYTFDYMLNRSVERQLPATALPRRYFRWDPYNKTLKATTKDRFILLVQ